MQNVRKVNPSSNEYQRGRNVPSRPASPPDIIDIDVLASMSDSDLWNRYQVLQRERVQVANSLNDVRPWEEELAYVDREMQIRRQRREAHERYVSALNLVCEREQREERYLPEADLDNSSFLELN